MLAWKKHALAGALDHQPQVRSDRRQIVADVRRELLASAGLQLPSLTGDPVAEALLRGDWLSLLPAGLIDDQTVIAELLLRQQQQRLGVPLPNMHVRDAEVDPASSSSAR
ncbi:hypothetical protein FA09DRAFT_326258 [Tilletiopsis washingtonensis]|uniref:Uncharacterized protein n=1 Tax=Tilletiopsis washingtonensis TaxID=58919 RepID=A0A316Z2X5_9BASI|nr:hypothetical protein FA09DRAFT_326258 [Tilletiopsis washingtonensis]PWN96147.1 hypothetical protein FA09DRAFT_326258 [Tilletiopsis washingtonensis]